MASTALKTPISYYGGKQNIAAQILPYIEEIPHTVYTEPFCGGLAVLYAKAAKPDGCNYCEAINDTNKNLITFWRVAREQPEELERFIDLTPYSQEEHRVAWEIYSDPTEYDDLKIAWATYIQCNMSFATTIGAGWATDTTSRSFASTWESRKQRLPECFERLRGVHIGCEDALRFIERFDSPHSLHYCDPPYPGTDQGHYKGYTIDDYAALCNALDNCQGSYILSNYSQDISPASAQKTIEIKTRMSAAGGKNLQKMDAKRIEKLWICDRSQNMRQDIAKIADKKRQLELWS